MKPFRLAITILLGALLVAATVGFTSGNRSSSISASTAASSLQNTFVDVFHRVSPSVVQIQTPAGLGSGIVFDAKGDIVTNDHVVTGYTTFSVTTSTGRKLSAKLVGEFPQDDLAVINVSGENLEPATFADSSKLKVGDIAMAIGNPLGLASSVTEGIVSALDRTESEGNGTTLPNAIQTSAAINPGNSGGALVDIDARVIGIPTLGATDPELGSTAAGIGFAIPSNIVTSIASQIVKYGHVVNSHRAYLGIQVGDTGGSGVYVAAVSAGGPAAKAGLAVGDVITAVAGQATPTTDTLGTVLAGFAPGKTVSVAVTKQSGAKATLSITLGEYPSGTTG
ncbi:MAG: trypsin-like peptidase domain-containing protein [Actinobacteria bacterium]|nr:trypsin-like peptidase domain-containing protein [Actinomycetota bacterium]